MSKLIVDQLQDTNSDLNVGVTNILPTYPSVAEMLADTHLKEGNVVQTLGYYAPGDLGNNTYKIVAAGGTTDSGSLMDMDGGLLSAQGLFLDGINVVQFGAIADGATRADEAFLAAAAYANLVYQKGDGQAVVHIPKGDFSVEEELDQDIVWTMDASANLAGSGGVYPSFVNDTYRLGGVVHRFIGSNQSTNLTVGDPAWTVQKLLEKATVGAIVGQSATASAGVCGVSYGSAKEGSGQSCMGLKGQAVNDPNLTARGVWGAYVEGYNMTGSSGNATGCEVVIHNGNGERPSNIFRIKNDPAQQTMGIWVTTTGSNSPDTEFYHNTAAIGIADKDDAGFLRGILFHNKSVPTWEAIAMPSNYFITWNTNRGSGPGVEEKRLGQLNGSYFNLVGEGVGGILRLRRINFDDSDTSSQDTVMLITGQGTLDDSAYAVTHIRGVQSTDFSSDIAGGRLEFDVRSGVTGSFTTHSLKPSTMSAGDNRVSVGEASNRYSQVYAAAGSINTSDQRKKQQITDPSEAELRVGARLQIRKFKFNDAVDEKGDSNARFHFGFIAQEVIEAFESEGLDAFDYGCVCYDEWDAEEEVIGSEGEIITPAKEAGDLYSVRYDECYALMMAAKFSE